MEKNMSQQSLKQLIFEMINDHLSKDTLDEQTGWVKPENHEEHDEVHTQLDAPHGTYPDHVHKMLNKLKDRDTYENAMKNGKSMTVTPISAKKMSNTDAGAPVKRGTIDSEKSARVTKQFSSGKPVTKPIVLHDTHTGHTHLLAGNTRLTHNTQVNKQATPVHAITYDSSKM
jgi:hypothetical protein